MESKHKLFLMLFLPVVLNIIIGSIISGYAYTQAVSRGFLGEDLTVEILVATYTWSFYWSILQIIFGLYAINLMGGLEEFKKSIGFGKFKDELKAGRRKLKAKTWTNLPKNTQTWTELDLNMFFLPIFIWLKMWGVLGSSRREPSLMTCPR